MDERDAYHDFHVWVERFMSVESLDHFRVTEWQRRFFEDLPDGGSLRYPVLMTDEETTKAIRAVKRKLVNARRETLRAVERFDKIDARTGHRAAALRLAREVRDAADDAVMLFSSGP